MADARTIKRPVKALELPAEVWYAGTDREIRGRALCDVGGKARQPATAGSMSPARGP